MNTLNAQNKLRHILLILSLLALCAGCQSKNAKPADGLVDIGTHRLYIHCTGDGSPVVVLDVGLGESYDNWQPIVEQLALDTMVCVYDRAGYGASQPGPLPRHSRQVAEELMSLLENAGVPAPYLLVGHSLGGLNVQVFADLYPEAVMGAVLLDPPPQAWIDGSGDFPALYEMADQQTLEFSRTAAALGQSSDPAESARAGFFQALASEHEAMFNESAVQAGAIQSFDDLPLVVIQSGAPNPAFGESAAAFQQFWVEQSRALAGKSSQGRFILAEASGHAVYQDAPDTVIDAVRGILNS